MLAPLVAVSGGSLSAVGGFWGDRSTDLLGKHEKMCVRVRVFGGFVIH